MRWKRPGPQAVPASAARKARSADRREAILAAALDEFASRGFEAARLDDVARRAGVAKGTIYLYFRDKESLFQELIRTMLTPLVGTIEALGQSDVPLPMLADRIAELFVREVYETRRKDVVRLMISEGRRFPEARRILLPRGSFAHYRRGTVSPAARCRTRRSAGGACRVPADYRGAGHARDHLERAVRTFRAAGRSQNDEDASRSAVLRAEDNMKMTIARMLTAAAAMLALAGCSNNNDRVLQGWVEAELIFVSPDEQGRVETLKVREGDQVQKGDVLFTVDDDLQKADVVVRNTAVINAQQSFDRAKELLKSAAGTQKTYEDAEAALRQAKANLDWSQTRLGRRNAYSPGDGTIEQIYYRAGRNRAGGPAGGGAIAAGQFEATLLRPASHPAGNQIWPNCRGILRRLREGPDCQGQLHCP